MNTSERQRREHTVETIYSGGDPGDSLPIIRVQLQDSIQLYVMSNRVQTCMLELDIAKVSERHEVKSSFQLGLGIGIDRTVVYSRPRQHYLFLRLL